MLKYQNVAEVGQTIRALDFEPMPDRPDAFIEGVVIRKGKQYMEHEGRKIYMGDGYTIKVTKSVSSSEAFDAGRLGEEMIVPFEMSLDFDNRVRLL